MHFIHSIVAGYQILSVLNFVTNWILQEASYQNTALFCYCSCQSPVSYDQDVSKLRDKRQLSNDFPVFYLFRQIISRSTQSNVTFPTLSHKMINVIWGRLSYCFYKVRLLVKLLFGDQKKIYKKKYILLVYLWLYEWIQEIYLEQINK